MSNNQLLNYYEEWMETTNYLRQKKYCEDMIFAIKNDCMKLVNRKWNNAYRNLEESCDAGRELSRLKKRLNGN